MCDCTASAANEFMRVLSAIVIYLGIILYIL
jgi:hypothetical protein